MSDDEGPSEQHAPHETEDGDDPGPLRRALQIVLPLLVIAAGVGGVWLLKATAPSPAQAPEDERGPLVEVVALRAQDAPITIRAHGTVVAATRAQIAPEVAGRIVWVSERLTEGGRFDEGEPMLRIDPADYRRALASRRGAVERARLGLLRERRAREVSTETWELAEGVAARSSEQGRALARNEPQVETAEAELASARSRARQARADLSRTTLRAPFAAQVQAESVDIGQLASPQRAAVTLVGTDAYHVRASVPVGALPRLRIPPAGTDENGSEARVTVQAGAERAEWEGWIGGMLPAVDERGAMARVVVVVPDPLGLEREERPALPLLLGAFVDVALVGAPLADDAVRVPRAAIRDGDRVYVATRDGRLAIRDVAIAWRGEDAVLATAGVEPGERAVVSRLTAPVDGMELRTADAEDPADGALARGAPAR